MSAIAELFKPQRPTADTIEIAAASAAELATVNSMITSAYDQTFLGLAWLASSFLDPDMVNVQVGFGRVGTLKLEKGEVPPKEENPALGNPLIWARDIKAATLPVKSNSKSLLAHDSWISTLKRFNTKGVTIEIKLASLEDFNNRFAARLMRGLTEAEMREASKALREHAKKVFKNPDEESSFTITHKALLSNTAYANSSEFGYVELEEYQDFLHEFIDIEYDFKSQPLRIPSGDTGEMLLAGLIFEITARLSLPIDFVRYVTSTEPGEKVSRSVFGTWLHMTYRSWAGESLKTWPVVITHPKTVMNGLRAAEAKYPGFRPRIGTGGWTILGSGKPIKFPKNEHGQRLVDAMAELDQHLDRIDSEQDPRLKEKLIQEYSRIKADRIGGKIMLVDWTNDRALVADNVGNIALEYIDEARPVDDAMLHRMLNMTLLDSRVKQPLILLMDRLGRHNRDRDRERRWEGDNNGMLPAGEVPPADVLGLFHAAVSAAVKDPRRIRHLCLQHLEDFEDDGAEGARMVDALRKLHAAIVELWPKEAEIMSNFQEENRFGMMGFLFEMIATTTPQRYEQLNEAQRKTLTSLMPAPLPEVLSIPNITKRKDNFEFLLPQQRGSLSDLGNAPENAMVGVDAGGGKTIIAIVDSVLGLTGRIRRPLIVAPLRLLGSWVSEINSVSQGKLNAMPLRPSILKALLEQSQSGGGADSVNTFDSAVRWLSNMPRNTIFVTTLDDPTSESEFFDQPKDVPLVKYWHVDGAWRQFLQLLTAVGFDYIGIDESQFIKNKTTRRYRDLARLSSRAKYKRLFSGTLVFNTIVDLHGQISFLDPSVCGGDREQFMQHYGIVGSGFTGSISDDNRRAMLADIGRSILMIKKKRSEWSFLLPKLVSVVHDNLRLTPKQSLFYMKMIQEIAVPILQKKWKDLEKEGGVAEDDDSEETEKIMEQVLAKQLQRVDQFIASPDSDPDYPNFAPGGAVPTGADLVSPKVAAADAIIDKQLADPKAGKTMVFGYYQRTSQHFMKHTRHKSVCVHYTANGGEEALRRFKDDPNVKVLVADETSIQVGQNLQIASTIIRMETVWSPGGYEQALARIYRPDPRGQYSHEFVYHHWMVAKTGDGQATIDVMKSARLFSKGWANAALDYSDEAKFIRLMGKHDPDGEQLPIIKLGAETILNFQVEDAEKYKAAWTDLEDFLHWANGDKMRSYAAQVRTQHGVKLLDDEGRVIDRKQFIRYVVSEIEEAPQQLSGSKRIYTPWVAGAKMPDPLDLGLKPFDDDATGAKVGMYVWTEFGPGILEALVPRKNGGFAFKVLCAHGFVRMTASRIANPTAKGAQDRIKNEIMPRAMEHVLLPPGVRALKPFANRVKLEKDAVKPTRTPQKPATTTGEDAPAAPEPKREKTREKPQFVDVIGEVIDGMPALVIRQDIPAIKDFEGVGRWQKTVPFISVQFASAKGGEAFIEAVDKKFALRKSEREQLLEGVETYLRRKRLLADVRPTAQEQRKFFIMTHRKLGLSEKTNKPVVNPMWVTFSNFGPVIAFSANNHNPAVIKWLRTTAKTISGVKRVVNWEEPMWVSFFSRVSEAKSVVKALAGQLKLEGFTVDMEATNAELDDMRIMLSKKKDDAPVKKKGE